MDLDSASSLLAAGAARFAWTFTSPVAVLGVLGAGALLRWRPGAIRLSAILMGIGLTIPAVMGSTETGKIVAGLLGAMMGALLIAEVLIRIVMPPVRRLAMWWAAGRRFLRRRRGKTAQ